MFLFIQKNPFDYQRSLNYAKQITCALLLLHSTGIIHRDIKSPNVLIKDNNRCVLSDFGLSGSKETVVAVSVDNPWWHAPEEELSMESDIYSLGIVLWELFEWKVPFGDYKFMNKLRKAVVKGVRPSFEKASTPTRNLISRCWDGNPSNRPRIEEVVSFFNKLKE